MNKGFDTYRAFAFFAVFFFHTGTLNVGYLGVHAFFVLSGFLITPILISAKKNNNTLNSYLINFYGRRSLRIFPAYYGYLAVTTAIILSFGATNTEVFKIFFEQLPFAATYTYNFFNATKYYQLNNFVSHFWSLAVEEQFYLAFPFLIYFVGQRKLKAIFIALIIAGPFIRYGIGYIVDNRLINILAEKKDHVVYVLGISHIDAFVVGGFFSVFSKGKVVPTKTLIVIFIAIIVLGFLTSKLFIGDFGTPTTLGYRMFMYDSYKYIWGYTLYSLLFATILNKINSRTLIPVIFENGIMTYLGKISYGMYIYHAPILYLVHTFYSSYSYHPDHTVEYRYSFYEIVSSLVFTIIISIISYEYFEKRFLLLKDRFFNKGERNEK